MKITAVIVAGGKGTRMGADKNKVFLKILGREVLYYTISAFEKNDKIDDIIVVTGKNDIEECQILVDKYDIKKVSYITEGGATRQESVMNGLKKAEGDIVLIHDGARALVTDDDVGLLMLSSIRQVKFDGDIADAIGAFLAIIMMPLTYSIANGIMFGIVSWVILKLVTGKAKDISAVMWISVVLFAIYIGLKAAGLA